MKQPSWATRIIERICTEHEMPIPPTRWIRKQRFSSSGRFTYGTHQITINAGSDKMDQRVTLLHELAHYINCYKKTGKGHDDKFWDIAFGLFHDKRNRVKKRYALRRSTNYKRKAKAAYTRRKLK